MRKAEFIAKHWPHCDPFARTEVLEPRASEPHSWHYDRDFLEPIYQRYAQAGLLLEVGSWLGHSALRACDYYCQRLGHQDFTLICVDTWLGSADHWLQSEMTPYLALQYGHPNLYPQFLEYVLGAGYQEQILPLPQNSLQAARILGRLDLTARFDWVYLDASHEPGDVLIDLMHYWPLVRPGGTLMGDDWNWPGVQQSVRAYLELLQQQGGKASLRHSFHSWAIEKTITEQT